jgi:hypothetical protein
MEGGWRGLPSADFDLRQQRRFDPDATVRDLLGARLRFSDQRLEQSSPRCYVIEL